MLDSLASIAKDTIARKNPFPILPPFDDCVYACKWGLTDFYPEHRQALKNAIENRQTFDTDWASCKKEIRSVRIISDGKVVTIQTFAEMDDIEDLIYDALDDGVELTDEQVSEVLDAWYNSPEIATETNSERTIPVTSFEEVLSVISEMESADEAQLNAWFEIVKSWVKGVLGT